MNLETITKEAEAAQKRAEELNKLKATWAKLEKLATEEGYKSVEDLQDRITAISSPVEARKPKTRVKTKGARKSSGKQGKMTPEKHVKLLDMVKEGKLTNQEMADKLGVSVPTVSNYKKKKPAK